MRNSKCILLKGKNLSIRNLKIKELKRLYRIPKNFFLVKSLYTGVCGSDLHKIRLGSKDEIILGHECVIEINKKKYVVNPLLPCGKCEMCKKGYENLCKNMKTIGYDFPGGFSEYFFIRKENLYKVKDSPLLYVLLDAFTSVYHGIKNIEQLLDTYNIDEALIIGDGIIGFFAAFLCRKYLQFRKIKVIGKHKQRLKAFSEIVNVETFLLKKNKCPNINKSSFTIEAVGGKDISPIIYAISLTKYKGILLSYGVFDPNKLYKVPLRNVLEKELIWIGSKSYTSREFKKSLKLFKSYKNDLNSLKKYLRVGKLEEIYHLLKRPASWKEKFLKVIINWGDESV